MEGIKVLLVDDEAQFIAALGKRLTKRGYEVRETHSGDEALAALTDFDADVAVLDVKMAGMDGLTVLHKLKQDWPLVEAIMLTGHASMEAAIRGMELGAFDYLMKPVEFSDLLYKLEDAAGRRRLQLSKIEQAE